MCVVKPKPPVILSIDPPYGFIERFAIQLFQDYKINK